MCKELATLFPTSAVFWNGTVHTLRKVTAEERVVIAKTTPVKPIFEMANTWRPQHEATFVK